jgi:NAD-reducing hydrogenase large subunit
MPKITIEPVTRIEGHAKITIHLNDDGKVEKAYFIVNEFRGFEKFSEGRPFFEMTQITPRICGICPVSHHLAAAKACDRVAGAQVPRTASLLRELMHMGQMIQSHAMHFFLLAGPDLLLGFDADPKIRNVAGLIKGNPSLALNAVKARAFGQGIIRKLSGKSIHGNYAVTGGVNAPLHPEVREAILSEIDEVAKFLLSGIEMGKRWFETNKALMNSYASFPSGYMGTVGEDGSLNLYDGKVRLIDRNGKKLEEFDSADYLDYIGEHVEDWSYLKFPFYRKTGWSEGTYRVGPLARLNVAEKISTPLAQKELVNFKSINYGKPVEGTLWYHYARLIEALHAIERVRQILEDPDIMSDHVVNDPKIFAGKGVGSIEAPRGTLFHDYTTDPDGMLTRVNLIVATGHNNWAMSKSVEMVARQFVDGKKLSEGMLNRVEAAIRAHDPCLSCSTHAMGSMPMIVELFDRDGNRLDKIIR